MADTDVIAPALTPEQWANAFREVPGTIGPGYAVSDNDDWRYTIRAYDVGEVSIEVPDGQGADIGPGHIPALIALANAALPVGNPYKITREDVETIRAATGSHDWYVALERIAGQLAALLPPE
jgi:hypothetical protein